MGEWHQYILEQSTRIAESRFHSVVTPEHLMLALLKDPAVHRSLSEVVADPDMDLAALYNTLVKHIDRDMNLLTDKDRNIAPDISLSVSDILRAAEERSAGFALGNMFNSRAEGEKPKSLPYTVGILLEILHRGDTYAAESLKSVGVRADDLMSFVELGPKIPLNPKGKLPKPPKFS